MYLNYKKLHNYPERTATKLLYKMTKNGVSYSIVHKKFSFIMIDNMFIFICFFLKMNYFFFYDKSVKKEAL